MKNATTLLLTMTVLFFVGFNRASIITGVVFDSNCGEPVSEVGVYANAQINIKEDKKYESFSTTTNSFGEFTIKGLADKYRYTLSAYKEDYLIYETKKFQPDKKGKILILEEPLNILRTPVKEGVFLFSNHEFIKVIPTTFLQTIYG